MYGGVGVAGRGGDTTSLFLHGSVNKGDGGAPGFPGKGPTLQSWNMLAMFVTALVFHEASGELKDLATSKAEPMSTTLTVDQASRFWSNCVAALNVDLRR